MARRVAVIGAGPVGLEAALYARARGYDATVYERGQRVGANVRQWGWVRLFSPWRLNRSRLGERAVIEGGGSLEDGDSYPTGFEYVERYLEPLAAAVEARGGVFELGAEVVAAGREGALKGDLIGQPERGQRPFRLLVSRDGKESVVHADVVLDCTGTYGHSNRLGAWGVPAPGEGAAAAAGWIDYVLRDIAGTDRDRFAGRRVLVVGAGYSAATSLDALVSLADRDGTRVLWATLQTGQPYERIPNDPLPERDRLARAANAWASGAHPAVEHLGGASIEALEPLDHDVAVHLEVGGARRVERVDRVLAHVGFTPDRTLHQELQIHECYASFGVMKLAAALLAAGGGAAGGGGGDCLAQASPGPETLVSPEPNYFILGAKSYGRNSSFLVKLGLEQIRDVFTLITGEAKLDLYGT